MDYEVQRSSRHCAVTGREFAPGETFYSAVVVEGADVKRIDYAADAWPGAPENSLGWWKTKVPDRSTTKKHWAPNDVMLQFWDELADQPDKQEMRYVLTLLLIRRRVLQLEEEIRDAAAGERLLVRCIRRDTTHEVQAVAPDPLHIEKIQEELAALLQ